MFLLLVLNVLTGGWRHRAPLAALLILAVQGSISFITTRDPVMGALDGAVSGVALVVITYGLLRFDRVALPWFLVCGAMLQVVENDVQKGTLVALLHTGLAILLAIAVASCFTHYLQQKHSAAITVED